MSKGESVWSGSCLLHAVVQTTRCLDALFIPMGVSVAKISALFVNGSAFIAPGTGRMAATEQNNNCFLKAAKSFQMVAEPQSTIFKPIKLSHFSPHHASSYSMNHFRNRCNQFCRLTFTVFYWTGSEGHYYRHTLDNSCDIWIFQDWWRFAFKDFTICQL